MQLLNNSWSYRFLHINRHDSKPGVVRGGSRVVDSVTRIFNDSIYKIGLTCETCRNVYAFCRTPHGVSNDTVIILVTKKCKATESINNEYKVIIDKN